MKKILLFAILIALLLLPACGSAPEPASDGIEILWLVRQDVIEQQWQNGVITDFESKTPGIKVRLEVAAPEEYDSRMQVLTAAGTPPDIFSHWGTAGFMDYVLRDLAADLTPYIERDRFDLDDFEPAALDPLVVDGRVYGLPMQTAGTYVFYNKDLFDQAGVAYPPVDWEDTSWTYEAFLEKCAALTDASADVYGCSLDMRPNLAIAWLWGQDVFPADIYESGFADTAFLDHPVVVEAFQSRQDIVWKHRYMPEPAQVEALGDDDLFASQKVAMLVAGGWGWRSYRGLQDFRWGAAALPFAGEERMGVNFTNPWMLSTRSEHPEEAWSFLKYLAEPATQASWMVITGVPPARTSLAEEWYKMFPFMDPAEVREVHTGALAHGQETPRHMVVRFDLLDRIIAEALEPVYANEKDASQTLPPANSRLIEALKQIRAEYQKPPTPTPTGTESPVPTETITETPAETPSEAYPVQPTETPVETTTPYP